MELNTISTETQLSGSEQRLRPGTSSWSTCLYLQGQLQDAFSCQDLSAQHCTLLTTERFCSHHVLLPTGGGYALDMKVIAPDHSVFKHMLRFQVAQAHITCLWLLNADLRAPETCCLVSTYSVHAAAVMHPCELSCMAGLLSSADSSDRYCSCSEGSG